MCNIIENIYDLKILDSSTNRIKSIIFLIFDFLDMFMVLVLDKLSNICLKYDNQTLNIQVDLKAHY